MKLLILYSLLMTLRINVVGVQSQLKNGQLYVEGNTCGILVSPTITNQNHRFMPCFKIICSYADTLKIKLCESLSQFKNGEYVAMTQILGPVLARQQQDKFTISFDLCNSNNKVTSTIDMEITYNKLSCFMGEYLRQNIQQLGIKHTKMPDQHISIRVTNIPKEKKNTDIGDRHVSETAGNNGKTNEVEPDKFNNQEPVNKDIRIVNNKKGRIQLYNGKCSSRNLFSMFDPAAEGQTSKFIETVYGESKDHI